MRPALPAVLPAVLPAALLAALLALPAAALPRHYALQAAASHVGYTASFGADAITGTLPVASADLTLDFESLANCHVTVVLDVRGATASFPFAAQALKGPLVLDAAAYPQIRFVSTAVRPAGDGATVDGLITIRGVTKPVTLAAALYRQRGTQPGQLDHLEIRLTGTLHRAEFGAGGWADLVGDAVAIDILAVIDRVPA